MVVCSDWAEVAAPQFPEIPTMLTQQERRYLFWLASTQLKGEAEIVEVGTWLGGSTACLAAGMEKSVPAKKLHSYDNFVWITGYNARALGLKLKEGDDFHPYFRKFVDARVSNVESTKAEIKDIVWKGGPIEVLFLDAPKNKEDMLHCIDIFFPSLIPGKSTVVFQDFGYAPAYSIPAVVSMMGDSLKMTHVVSSASTFAFHYAKALNPPESAAYDYEKAPVSVVDANWDKLVSGLPQQPADYLAISRAMMLSDSGRLPEAIKLLSSLDMSLQGKQRYKFYGGMGYLQGRYGELFKAVPPPKVAAAS
jgi:hypothetical protein